MIKYLFVILSIVIFVGCSTIPKEKKVNNIIWKPFSVKIEGEASFFHFKNVSKCKKSFSKEQIINANYETYDYISSIVKIENENSIEEKVNVKQVWEGTKNTISVCIDDNNQIKVKIERTKQIKLN